MKEKYNKINMRPVLYALDTAQVAISSIVVKGEEESIFEYRKDNPELYKLYMDINECALIAHELMDN